MTDYLLDTNILLRVVQPQAPTHRLAVEAMASILENGNKRRVLQKSEVGEAKAGKRGGKVRG